MLGFSTAFASPFFVLALFPSMLKKLPRSGGWMNDVKVVIGIVELAAVVKFLSVADIGFSVGRIPVYVTYNVFLLTWILLAAIAALYLLGVGRKPRPKFSMIRYGTAAFFILFAGRLSAGLAGAQLPTDPIWNLVAAFAPPDVHVRKTQDMGYVISHHKLDFLMDFDRAVDVASKDDHPLFVDFTGVNCVNCRKMERTVMVEANVLAVLNQLVRAQLYTDQVPGITDAEFRNSLLEMNRELQSELVNDVTLPYYAVVSADGKTVLSVFNGLDQTGGKDFLQFLNAGLQRWEAIKEGDGKSAGLKEASETVVTGQFPEAN
jgi:thiol:disulfide interchange protein DsbD